MFVSFGTTVWDHVRVWDHNLGPFGTMRVFGAQRLGPHWVLRTGPGPPCMGVRDQLFGTIPFGTIV